MVHHDKVSVVSTPTTPTTKAVKPPTPSRTRILSSSTKETVDDDSIKALRKKKFIRIPRLSPLENDSQSPFHQFSPVAPSSREKKKHYLHDQHQLHQQQREDDASSSQSPQQSTDGEVERLRQYQAILSSEDSVEEWILTYEAEKQQFASFALLTEMKLDQIQGNYVDIVGRPNAVEVAACCATLLKMPGIVGCYTSLLQKLAIGIQSALYLPEPSQDSEVIYSSCSSSTTPMATLVRNFYKRKPYFERMKELEQLVAANRSIGDMKVLRSLTIDEIAKILRFTPFNKLRAGLLEVFAANSSVLEQLKQFVQEQHAQYDQSMRPNDSDDERERDDLAYPIHVPLSSSAQICRAIAHNAGSFSSSGKEMIMCSILEFIDVESFRDVFKRFDNHGKACFLHHVSVVDSSDHLHAVIDHLPNPGESLFRLYFIMCTSADATINDAVESKSSALNSAKDVFFHKLLSTDMEYFFLCDLAGYLSDEQWKLLSKEFEKFTKERRKTRQRIRRLHSTTEDNDDNVASDEELEETDDEEKGLNVRQQYTSIEKFQLMAWSYIRHHQLTSAQVLALIVSTFLPSLDEKECGQLINNCLDRFTGLDGKWGKVLNIVEDMEPDQSSNKSESDVHEKVRIIRFGLLKKLFSMLSREQRDAWIDKINAKYPTEAYRRKTSLVQDQLANAKLIVLNAAPDISSLNLNEPKEYVAQMTMDCKIRWIECLLDSITNDKEYSARMSMLKQVLQPFLDGKLPSNAALHAVIGSNGANVTTSASPVEQSPKHLSNEANYFKPPKNESTTINEVKMASKVSEDTVSDHKLTTRTLDSACSPIPFHVEKSVSNEPPAQPQLTSNQKLLDAFKALLLHHTEDKVLTILQKGLLPEETMAVTSSPIPPPNQLQQKADGQNEHSQQHEAAHPTRSGSVGTITTGIRRRLSAVMAVAEPMEWQECVRINYFNVGCQTNFENEAIPIGTGLSLSLRTSSIIPEAENSRSTHSTQNHHLLRASILPTKLGPVTISALLGKSIVNSSNTPSSSKRKDNKYLKINSAAVPRPIAGLITSWRMNSDQLVQFAKKSLPTVLKIIADAYGEMLTASRRKNAMPFAPHGPSRMSRELTLAQIVYQSFLHSYGLPGIADTQLLAFTCAVEMYRAQHLRVEYFARFCFEEVPKTELANYLEYLECLVCEDSSLTMATGGAGLTNTSNPTATMPGFSKRMRVPRVVVPDKEIWTVSVEKAQDVAQLCFRSMRKSAVTSFCDRLVDIAARGGSMNTSPGPEAIVANSNLIASSSSSSDLQINVDHLLRLVVHEWRDEQVRRETHLLNAFRAGDVNGDGQLTSAEFTQIVLSIDHTRDLGDILLMYSDTIRRTQCATIDTEIFLQVAKEHELDRVIWNDDGELRQIANDLADMEHTWRHVRGFFLGTLEALVRNLPLSHFLRVCEGAGCGCLKCILDGYIGFQKMRYDVMQSRLQHNTANGSGNGARNSCAVSEGLIWGRFWHLMRQLYDAAAESDGIVALLSSEVNDREKSHLLLRKGSVPAMAPRLVNNRRNALPTYLLPDTNRISAKMSEVHDPEVFDAPTINRQFERLLDRMTFKTNGDTMGALEVKG